jgi:predicted metal-binding membrane protein
MVNAGPRSAAAPSAALAATLGVAAACWAATIALTHGMDMGIATRPGEIVSFAVAWVTMMAAMMLPGAAPAVARHVRGCGKALAALPFTAAYLGLWAIVGVVAYATDLPHGPAAAGVVVIAAGGYELTPLKRHFRRRCREEACDGLGYGLSCLGSGLGLMAMLVALDVMSLLWMSIAAAVTCAQKLLPARAAIDVPVALALIGLGVVLITGPSLVPGLTPPASMPGM